MQTQRDHLQSTPHLGRYEIDASGSAVTFRTRHLFGLAPVRGTFAIRSGTVDVAEPLTESRIRVEIDAASFRTGSGQRDRNVRSARFLDPARYPDITFDSGTIDGAAVTGTLTVRGVARTVSVPVTLSAVSQRSFTARGTARIDRTGFGVTASRGLAGRYLDISVEVRCVLR